ncbi:hypothetical protein GCM10025867_37980 [Frondihabitans sucicola]|uniref:Glycosyltransferase 2-like domain-containing protein n=1 Tax=Frondihabitans sucicola TaxID=1268041 RepID=A0ABM8GT00_9MICO|nr:hypothetical protein GCM10025867_37980 [Frondihabitans sucicola]
MTIVVPIYDDLDGLLACLRSLIQHVDFGIDRVILANDAGPNADVIETAVLRQIDGHRGFEYHRNDLNLGFLGNCNNVVLNLDHSGNDVMLLNSDTVVTAGFLDEMAAVLDLSETHGVVAPRSNNATIATIPHLRRNLHAPMTLSRTSAVHAAVAPLLPRFTIAPVAMGFCFLIRRELIDRYGLFDERFSPGYGEENDFCLRINEHGYASLLANRALVFHTGSTSFSGDRGPSLRFAHEKVLIERYPHYVGALQLYQHVGRDPVDRFADAFLPGDHTSRIAIEVTPEATAEALPWAERIAVGLHEGIALTVLVPRSRLAAAKAAIPSATVRDISTAREVFDVVVGAGAVTSLSRLLRLNELAPRLVVVDADMPRDARWARRVAGSQEEAVRRLSREYADHRVASHTVESVVEALHVMSASRIDVETLRRRWSRLIDIGAAAGLTMYPKRATLRRRAALLAASRTPRITRWLRSVFIRA